MIVRPARDRLQLITQPDHARLSRTIMEHCVPLASHARRETILHAIAEHDNGWAEEDAAPRVNPTTGQIFDFITAPKDVRQAVWPRGITRLRDDPWAAALVAQHALNIYERFRTEAEWAPFFATLETARVTMLRASGQPFEDLVADYQFVPLADVISLTFCTGWTDEQRAGERTIQLSDTHVVVSPDIFGGVEIPIAVTACEISRQPFSSDAELRRAVSAAKPTTLRGVVTGRGESA